MAGEALHALSLGNVKTIRTMLDASKHAEIRKIAIIGTQTVGVFRLSFYLFSCLMLFGSL